MSGPALSVVVAATDSSRAVAQTVASILAQGEAVAFEIIVAAARDQIDPRSAPVGVAWVAAPAGTPVPRLRRLGGERARAPVVVFTEDSCRFPPGWLAAWLAAFEDRDVRAATGPIEPAMGEALVDWAVFFCEYAPFLPAPERRPGPPQRLAGNNFAIRRAAYSSLARQEIHEVDVFHESGADGGRVVEVEAAWAAHVRRYGLGEALGDRLRFGLEFGRLRARGCPRWRRVPTILAGPAILAAQLARMTSMVLHHHRVLGRFVRALPVTLALLAAWSAGESIGWATAPPAEHPSGRPRGTAGRPSARLPGPAWWRRSRCRAGRPPA